MSVIETLCLKLYNKAKMMLTQLQFWMNIRIVLYKHKINNTGDSSSVPLYNIYKQYVTLNSL